MAALNECEILFQLTSIDFFRSAEISSNRATDKNHSNADTFVTKSDYHGKGKAVAPVANVVLMVLKE